MCLSDGACMVVDGERVGERKPKREISFLFCVGMRLMFGLFYIVFVV